MRFASSLPTRTRRPPSTSHACCSSGSIITSEVSGPTGQVVFTDVPDGIYTARVFKRGYNAVTSARFEVLEGRSVTVNVALAIDTGGLKVIGSVSVKSTASVSTTSIGQDSAQRKLSNDLADAMNKLSGVSVSTSGDDTSSTQTISLEGQDSSQTQLTLDGIPVSAPGAGGNLGSFNTDLFSGASVSFGPQLGGLAGGVNFRTIDPTISWLSQITGSVGSFGKYNYSLAESGSDGKLGLAAMVTNRLQPSLIDGDVYLDASGLDYVHEGDVTSNGALLKLRFTSNDSQSLTGTFLSSTRDAELVCLRFSGALPCGYGPGNYANGSTQLYSLTDNALIGDTTIQASVFSTNSKNLQDQLQRYVDGEAQPIGYGSSTTSTGFTATGDLPSKDRHTFSVTAYGTQSSAITTPLVPEAQPYYNSTQTSGYAAIQLNDTIHSNAKLTLLESAGINGANNAQTSVLASTGLTWRPTSVDTYTASYAVGGAAPQPSRSQILTDPASMRFDCNGNVAYGNAPGEQPGASSSISARVGYTRSMRVGNVSVQIYRQVQNDVVLPTQVNGTVLEALGDITPQYIAEIEQVFQSAGGCNTTATLGASQLYFTTPIGGVTRVYEGGRADRVRFAGRPGRRTVLRRHGIEGALERLAHQQSVFHHDSGQSAAQRSLAESRRRARLQGSALRDRVACRRPVRRSEQPEQPSGVHDVRRRGEFANGTRLAHRRRQQHHQHVCRRLYVAGQFGSVYDAGRNQGSDAGAPVDATIVFADLHREVWRGCFAALERHACLPAGRIRRRRARRIRWRRVAAPDIAARRSVRRHARPLALRRGRRGDRIAAVDGAQELRGGHRSGEDAERLPGDDDAAGARRRDDYLPRHGDDLRTCDRAQGHRSFAGALRLPARSHRA